MLASDAPCLRLGASLACIFVSWICLVPLIAPYLSAGNAVFVPIVVINGQPLTCVHTYLALVHVGPKVYMKMCQFSQLSVMSAISCYHARINCEGIFSYFTVPPVFLLQYNKTRANFICLVLRLD